MKRKVFLTGATGVMGSHGLRELCRYPDRYEVTVLARPGRRNERKLAPYIGQGVKVVWGDLKSYESVASGVKQADVVLHVGGLVSPEADKYPEKTIEINLTSIKNIIRAAEGVATPPAVVYIGSVAQYGDRNVPNHWGACGDLQIPSYFDAYGYSKTEAERLLAESCLPKWVSLRQTGILHSGLLTKASNPVAFHVPIRGVLEWVTAEDSGRLLERVCRESVPDFFWNKFYNVGGGAAFRLTNYEFEAKLLKAMGCPPPEKVFDTKWFTTKNFHGFWFSDSDKLEELLHFRSGRTPEEYFGVMKSELPWFYSLAVVVPAWIIKAVMKRVAHTKDLGPMWWIKNDIKQRIQAGFGSRESWEKIASWKEIDLRRPSDTPTESAVPDYSYSGIKSLVRSRGGDLLSPIEENVEPESRLELSCNCGHRFSLKARTLVEGGHWCPECLKRYVTPDEIKGAIKEK